MKFSEHIRAYGQQCMIVSYTRRSVERCRQVGTWPAMLIHDHNLKAVVPCVAMANPYFSDPWHYAYFEVNVGLIVRTPPSI